MKLLKKLIRIPLRWISPETEVSILIGKLRGKKWIVGSGIPAQWIGYYESGQGILFAKACKDGGVVYDIGAHVGYYSLLAASSVGSSGSVYAFEPLPRNIAFLEQHKQLNNMNSINIFQVAVSDKFGEANFDIGTSNFQGALTEGKDTDKLIVKTIKLDDFVSENGLKPPDVMKIDVEGAEEQVLIGAESLLISCKPIIFLSLHEHLNPGVTRKCLDFLEAIGYSVDEIENESHAEVVARHGKRSNESEFANK
jgi:FkbM family methyltransferase